jgi:hypothetical protein
MHLTLEAKSAGTSAIHALRFYQQCAAVKKQASWGYLCLQNLLSASHKIPTSPCNQVIY